jgi:hypothetical protein
MVGYLELEPDDPDQAMNTCSDEAAYLLERYKEELEDYKGYDHEADDQCEEWSQIKSYLEDEYDDHFTFSAKYVETDTRPLSKKYLRS